jgi:hypothetical protein
MGGIDFCYQFHRVSHLRLLYRMNTILSNFFYLSRSRPSKRRYPQAKRFVTLSSITPNATPSAAALVVIRPDPRRPTAVLLAVRILPFNVQPKQTRTQLPRTRLDSRRRR